MGSSTLLTAIASTLVLLAMSSARTPFAAALPAAFDPSFFWSDASDAVSAFAGRYSSDHGPRPALSGSNVAATADSCPPGMHIQPLRTYMVSATYIYI